MLEKKAVFYYELLENQKIGSNNLKQQLSEIIWDFLAEIFYQAIWWPDKNY